MLCSQLQITMENIFELTFFLFHRFHQQRAALCCSNCTQVPLEEPNWIGSTKEDERRFIAVAFQVGWFHFSRAYGYILHEQAIRLVHSFLKGFRKRSVISHQNGFPGAQIWYHRISPQWCWGISNSIKTSSSQHLAGKSGNCSFARTIDSENCAFLSIRPKLIHVHSSLDSSS